MKLSTQDFINVGSYREIRDGIMIFHMSLGMTGLINTGMRDNIKKENKKKIPNP